MSAVAGAVGGLFGVLVIYLLVKNVGTQAKPSTGLGTVSTGLTQIVGDITGG